MKGRPVFREINHPPGADTLIHSIRSIGYTFSSAVADIVDNSIAARASKVDILLRIEPSIWFAIVDDGDGMDTDSLLNAMRIGSKHPAIQRNIEDLGRFGLGLKTASLSQCRRMTVYTRVRGGVLSGARWDLDRVSDTNEWVLQIMDQGRAGFDGHENLPLAIEHHGTAVVWEVFDRFATDPEENAEALKEAAHRARSHLELVFHRYIAVRRLHVNFNGKQLDVCDPFLVDQPGAQRSAPNTISLRDGQTLKITAHTIPHPSKLSEELKRRGRCAEGLRSSQGFYTYRKDRLITWGSWFDLHPKSELTKLTRIEVDIPEHCDEKWCLDVKKSTLQLPKDVRDRLRQLIPRLVEPSTRAAQHRGRELKRGHQVKAWLVHEDGNGNLNVEINREHPIYKAFSVSLQGRDRSTFSMIASLLEETVPIDVIYSALGDDKRLTLRDGQVGEDALYARLSDAYDLLAEEAEHEAVVELLARAEPYASMPTLIEKLKESKVRRR
jgi:hypothetical protein